MLTFKYGHSGKVFSGLLDRSRAKENHARNPECDGNMARAGVVRD